VLLTDGRISYECHSCGQAKTEGIANPEFGHQYVAVLDCGVTLQWFGQPGDPELTPGQLVECDEHDHEATVFVVF
jgi:hypothetical protein